jgi:hypothetical protein
VKGAAGVGTVTGAATGAVTGGVFGGVTGGVFGGVTGGVFGGVIGNVFGGVTVGIHGAHIGVTVGRAVGRAVGGGYGVIIGTLVAGIISDIYFTGIAERADNYLAPNIAALKAWEAISDFRNRSNFAPQALDLLKKAQQQDEELQKKLTSVFDTIPEESKKEFLSRFNTELSSGQARSTESAATIEGAPVDQLPQNFKDVAFILHNHIEKRIEARTILIEDLKKKLPETQSK